MPSEMMGMPSTTVLRCASSYFSSSGLSTYLQTNPKHLHQGLFMHPYEA